MSIPYNIEGQNLVRWGRLLAPFALAALLAYVSMVLLQSFNGDLFDHLPKQLQAVNKQSIQILVYVAVGVLWWVLYKCAKLRELIFFPGVREVQRHIKNELVSVSGLTTPVDGINDLKRPNNRKLIDIYYYFIDNDESLKVRRKNVFFNGFVWTLSIDFFWLGVVAAIIDIVFGVICSLYGLLGFGVLITVLVFLTFFFVMPNIKRKHKELSDEQLGYIAVHRKNELRQKISQVL